MVKHNNLRLMKKCILFLLCIMSSLSIWAESFLITNPGTLKETLMDADFSGTQLTITGTLNAADLSYIHDGTGRLANVTDLDISNIKVLPSEECYASGKVSQTVGDNLLPQAYFYYSEENYCDTTHTTDMLGRGHTTYKIHGNHLAGLFLDNASYRNVSLPIFLNNIGFYTFQNSNVENISFPHTYETIEDGAFISCNISSIDLPKECKFIGKYAFANCRYLSSINLENVTHLGNAAFSGANISGDIQLGKITEIPERCFNGCNISSVVLSSELKVIGKSAFSGSMTTLSLPEGLERIEELAFFYCSKLKSVIIPRSVSYIGNLAFPESLVKTIQPVDGIIYLGNVAYKFTPSLEGKTDIKFRDGTISLSPYLMNTSDYIRSTVQKIELPSSVKQIGDEDMPTAYDSGIFARCKKLETINLPEGLEEIGNSVFKGCTALKHITLPNSLRTIGSCAFENTGISKITFGDSLRFVDYYAFDNCRSLYSIRFNSKNARGFKADFEKSPIEKVVFGPKVEYIPSMLRDNTSIIRVEFEENEIDNAPLEIQEYAFEDCSSLKIASLPKRLAIVGRRAFDGIKEIISLKLYENSVLRKEAFYNIGNIEELYYDIAKNETSDCFKLSNIHKISIGRHVKSLPKELFNRNETLTSVIFEDRKANDEVYSLTIGESCFQGCNIETLKLPGYDEQVPEGVSLTFGKECFSSNPIKEFKMPHVPTRVEDEAFWGCPLESICLEEGISYIGNLAFRAISQGEETVLQSIDIPASVTEIYNNAFNAFYWIFHSSPTVNNPHTYSYARSCYYPKGEKNTFKDAFWSAYEYETTISQEKMTLALEESQTLTAAFKVQWSFNGAPNSQSFVWESSDPTVATVDGNGKVTAVSEGTATITAYLLHKGGNKKTCTVTVMSSTGINTPLVDKNSHQAYYDLSGNKLLVPQKGLIIVKYKNGKTKTVLIK